MSISLLRITCEHLSNFKNGVLSLDFFAEKRVLSEEVEDGTVYRLFGRIYKLNTVALAGINATGKTTVLSLLSNLLTVYIGNGSLDYSMRFKSYFDSSLSVESYFYQEEEKAIYKLISVIKKDDQAQSLVFETERLYKKTASFDINKNNLFDFAEENLVMDRARENTRFLKREDSIFSMIMNAYSQNASNVQDLCSITNHNLISAVMFDLLIPFAQYLDPSIEFIRLKELPVTQSSRTVFEIKFKQHENVLAVEPRDLELYLSSGTIKGISCFSAIAIALSRGGYVLIDEIENHLNKTIVIGLISLFSSRINEKGATLLFSTHYSEILDSLGRSDGIYLLDKDGSIELKKFSSAAGSRDRKDKKKSDLVLSGVLAKAPSYPAYRRMLTQMNAFLWGAKRND